jgi:hypothetical protein
MKKLRDRFLSLTTFQSLGIVEIAIATLLYFCAAILFANSKYCFFNQASCGMVEPLLGVIGVIVGTCIAIAGLFHYIGKPVLAALAYAPFGVLVLVLLGQLFGLW